MNWKFFFKRVWAYLSPTENWRERILAYRDGNGVWPVPGHPEMDPTAPWPSEWCVWEPAVREEPDGKPYPKLISGVSHVSGRLAEGEDAVRCARCSITLHVQEANMSTTLDIPACSWCVGSVRSTR